MDLNKSKPDLDKFSLTLCVVIVLASIFAEIMTYDKTQSYHWDLFSLTIGLVGYFAIFLHSQRIIDNNLFSRFAFIGLAILSVSIIKQAMTNYTWLLLFVAGLPLLFVGYFYLLTLLFYRDYPNSTKKPTIVFATRFGRTYFECRDKGYKPTIKEKRFSLLLSLGFMAFAFGLMVLIRSTIL